MSGELGYGFLDLRFSWMSSVNLSQIIAGPKKWHKCTSPVLELKFRKIKIGTDDITVELILYFAILRINVLRINYLHREHQKGRIEKVDTQVMLLRVTLLHKPVVGHNELVI